MSSLIAFVLLVRHPDAVMLDRINTYLASETRPDFPEDVPESEEEWVDAFEIIPYPEKIKRPEPEVMILEFYDEADISREFPEDLAHAISLSNPELILSYSFLEDCVLYDKWQGVRYETIWGDCYLEDDQEAELDAQTIKQLQKFGDDHNKILMYLSEVLGSKSK